MLSKILNVVLVILILGFIGNYIYRLPKFNDGEVAPQFASTLMDGSSFALSDLQGKYVLLDFWGSWCAPCRRENPDLVSLRNRFKSANFSGADGFEIVSIAIESNERQWKRAIEKDNLDWKYHIVQKDLFKSPIAQQYGVKEIPTKYLLSPDGGIISVNESPKQIAIFLDSKKK